MSAHSFLKCPGGKNQLQPQIADLLRPHLTGGVSYHEPFLGGGAILWAVLAEGFLGKSFGSDTNRDFISAYQGVQKDPRGLIERLRVHKRRHSESYYYKVRADSPRALLDRAARTIYLNKTGFNGLYRVNKAGKFNVPFGRYDSPAILDAENLHACALALRNVTIRCMDFEEALKDVVTGDVVYLDPPYFPVSKTARFTSFTKEGFTTKDQERLASAFVRLSRLGAKLVLSNADVPEARALYEGFSIRSVQARRAVNSDGAGRGRVPEIVVTNF